MAQEVVLFFLAVVGSEGFIEQVKYNENRFFIVVFDLVKRFQV